MNLEDLTIKEVREITKLFGTNPNQPTPFVVGKAYFIRTVTYHLTGRVKEISGQFLILAALYLNLCVSKPRNIIYWGILIAISASIHFYLFAFIFAIRK
jgi:hypothetical protein